LNTRVRAAFERLIACMQDIKERYYKSPPLLIEADAGGFFTGASCLANHSANNGY
jgi:hypothetical protein